MMVWVTVFNIMKIKCINIKILKKGIVLLQEYMHLMIFNAPSRNEKNKIFNDGQSLEGD